MSAGAGSVDLVAQSMGGVVAVMVALARPARVRRLVLTATSAGIDITPFSPEDWRGGYFKGERLVETCARVEKLKAFLGPEAPDLATLALKFVLSHPAVSTVIPGMRRVANVEANCAVPDGRPLSKEKLETLRQHAWPRNFYQGAWD